MTESDGIRLKIKIDSTDVEFTKDLELKFWYYLDINETRSIKALKQELMRRIFLFKKLKGRQLYNPKFSSVQLSLDMSELPCIETTRILRDLDVVIIHLTKHQNLPQFKNKKRKLQNQPLDNPSIIYPNETPRQKVQKLLEISSQIQPGFNLTDKSEDWDLSVISQPRAEIHYEACIIGTSMVKHIQTDQLFPHTKCFFKSISGGLIKHLTQCLSARELLLTHCKTFVITCGSNDMDKDNDVAIGCQNMLNLLKDLRSRHAEAKLVINKLIPRTKCKYTNPAGFEERRLIFNKFLENELKFLDNYVLVSHKAFEVREDLESLLSDGVHLSVTAGVPVYIEQIKKVLLD